MKNSRKQVPKSVATRARRANPQDLMWALLPSAEQLRQLASGPANRTSAQPPGGNLAASLDIPRALLNPLESLPRPLSLDDVKERLRATSAAHKTQIK